jgi:hypothetical protein
MGAALRCLAGIGELWGAPPTIIYWILSAEPPHAPGLCNSWYTAVIAPANAGKLDPDMAGSAAKDISAALVARASAGDVHAATALVGGYQDVKFGFQVLNMSKTATTLPRAVVVRLMLVIAWAGRPNVARNILDEWQAERFAEWQNEFPNIADVLRDAAEMR